MLQASEILNASILIVDDQEVNVTLLEQMLRNAGYTRITSTMDPRTVHALHDEHRYDLILLDLQMPEMDGFQVMEGLRDIEPDGYFPVLVITAQPGHKLRALQVGAKDFVSKPFDLVEVKTRIHNMLEVRLLYQKLDNYNKVLEQTVLERTAELRESEARFQRFTELSSDWYWEQDAQGKLTRFSGPVREMLGLGGDDAPAALAAGGWNVAERALLDENIAQRRPFLDLIYSRVHADGRTQFLQVSGEPMFDNGSRFVGYRGIGMDVTERMRPDMEHTRFRSAMDAIDQGICLLDPASLRMVDVNDTACRMSGYSREELFDLDPAAIGIGDGARMLGMFNELVAGGPVHLQSTQLRHKSGSTLPARIDWRAVQVGGKWVIVGVIQHGA
ncbi:MAG TPA: response regulator [Janthinobacterium sp.]|nr:response regulator [Janthinobacterium sp.]